MNTEQPEDMVYIARADGTRQPMDHVPDFKEAQTIIGGYIERVKPAHTPSVIFLCDEEGHLKGLPANAHGCELYGTQFCGPAIVGDIIVINKKAPGASRW